jgi:hypothetical protein
MVSLELHTVGPHSGTNYAPLLRPSGWTPHRVCVCVWLVYYAQMPTSWSLSSWIWGSSTPTGPLVHKFTGTLGAALTHTHTGTRTGARRTAHPGAPPQTYSLSLLRSCRLQDRL